MFQARRFLNDQFKSKEELICLVGAYGLKPPSTAAVTKWWQRDCVSGDWFPVLLAVLELEHGVAVSIANYVSFGGRHGGQ